MLENYLSACFLAHVVSNLASTEIIYLGFLGHIQSSSQVKIPRPLANKEPYVFDVHKIGNCAQLSPNAVPLSHKKL